MENNAWARFFSEGFFGYGEKGDFKYWSLAHFVPLLVFALGIYLIFRYREKIRDWKHEGDLRFAMAVAMIICEMSYYWRLVYVGPATLLNTICLTNSPCRYADGLASLPRL